MALSPGDKPIFKEISHSDFQTALNRPFDKKSAAGSKLDITETGSAEGRKHVNFQRLIFQEARVQNNQVETTAGAPPGTQMPEPGRDNIGKRIQQGAGAQMDNAQDDIFGGGFQFMVNPYEIEITYTKDFVNRVVKGSPLRCPKVHASLNRNVQFFGNKVTTMKVNGFTGVAEKSGMMQMLIELGSYGYWWWTSDKQAKGAMFGAGGSAGSLLYKKIGFLPVRWRIFHYACDTLTPWKPEEDVKNTSETIRNFQGSGSKQRKEKKRLYYGRIASLQFFQTAEEYMHDLRYEMMIHLDQFDESLGSGDSYITGL